MEPDTTPPPGLSHDDQEFAWNHARNYARPDLDPDRAGTYAYWYGKNYIRGAATLDDLPAHDQAWPEFLAWERAPEPYAQTEPEAGAS